MTFKTKITLGFGLLLILSLIHLFVGDVSISIYDFFQSLSNYDASNSNHIIARDLRIPRLFITFIAGSSLAISGMLMQTIFNNVLAGPNILGISSGSGLFVALTLMTGIHFFNSNFGLISSALLGAFVFAIILLAFAKFIRAQSSLLLIGIMLGSFAASFISIIQTISDKNQLKLFVLWSMGSLQQVNTQQIPLIFAVFILAVVALMFLIKSLNALTLGANNAALLGVSIRQVQLKVILIASILTGLITAFCGPIAFIGMAVPNLVKLIFRTQNHLLLIFANLIIGGSFLLFCDILVQLLAGHFILPINAITSIIGTPFIIYIIIKRWS